MISTKIPNTTLTEVRPRIFHVAFTHRYDTAMTFLRYQEYYEGLEPWFRKPFRIFDYMEWYAKNRGDGAFTYPTDWSGFNIPGWVLKDFFYSEAIVEAEHVVFKRGFLKGHLKDDWNPYDTFMNWIVYTLKRDHNIPKDDWNFYLIGTTSTHDQAELVLDHEIAHGLYYTNPEYKKEMDLNIASMPPEKKEYWIEKLIDLGYHKSVIDDEIQAYCATEALKANEGSSYKDSFRETFRKYMNI